MILLGLDVGLKKIGVALAASIVKKSRPLGLIIIQNGWERQLIAVLRQWQVTTVVIGDPGERAENTKVQEKISAIEELLKTNTLVTIQRWPEDYSSQEARMEQQHYPDQAIDAIAASLILQSYLDRHDVS
jgi:putative Holliday junction resolvase